jgi:(p)ppGpp synthase/HD superfamily hydrolase
MSERLSLAIAFAATAHAGQIRKYTFEPYVVHPIEVMMLVRNHAQAWTEDMLLAAVLHDVVEDTPVTMPTIERRFGPGVAALVFDLTDQFTREAHPDKNRKLRKQLERERLGGISGPAKTVKLADLISNTASISEHDPNFAVLYLGEKEALLPLLVGGDAALWQMAHDQLAKAQSERLQDALHHRL